jgi:hypothetical protein
MPGGEAQFAVGSLGAQSLGQFELLAGAAGERQRKNRLGGENRGRQNRALRASSGGMAKQPALEGRGQRGEPGDVDRKNEREHLPRRGRRL